MQYEIQDLDKILKIRFDKNERFLAYYSQNQVIVIELSDFFKSLKNQISEDLKHQDITIRKNSIMIKSSQFLKMFKMNN